MPCLPPLFEHCLARFSTHIVAAQALLRACNGRCSTPGTCRLRASASQAQPLLFHAYQAPMSAAWGLVSRSSAVQPVNMQTCLVGSTAAGTTYMQTLHQFGVTCMVRSSLRHTSLITQAWVNCLPPTHPSWCAWTWRPATLQCKPPTSHVSEELFRPALVNVQCDCDPKPQHQLVASHACRLLLDHVRTDNGNHVCVATATAVPITCGSVEVQNTGE